ncbi:SCP2 sterol-binding domain-containing protein [Halorientalis halophila]|uniref:SCP2 sterol-binding domain-containing protein n=1 Tax=Halorientalis halophila TaxID=3108499 RepID=UPI003009A9CB
MSTQGQQFELDDYFPTTAWLDRYQQALDDSEELEETGAGWGVDWNGDFVFEMENLPIEERTVNDLPEEVWEALEQGITQLPEDTLETVLEDAPEDVREGIESREGPLPERAAAELLETSVSEAPEKVWPGLRRVMPDIMDDLLDELEENVTDDGTVYAWIGLEDGGCYDTATMRSLDERDYGFVLTGDFDEWVDLVSGDLDVVEAIMSGKLELDGDMQKILQYSDAALSMTDVASGLDKRFLF